MSTPHWNRGVAAVVVRDTEHDSPTQRFAGFRFPDPLSITSAVDTSITNPSIYGGDIPDHSSHWRDYFGGDAMIFPTGKGAPLRADATQVYGAISAPQSQVVAPSDPWGTFWHLVKGPMRNGTGGGSITK